MKRMLSVVLALGAPASGSAHDLWVERAQQAFVVRHGHRGAELLPIDRAKLKAIRCGDGVSPPADVIRGATFSEKEVRFAGPCSVVAVFNDGGYWSLTPDGEVNLPKTQAANVVRSWASRQYAKWVDAKSPRAGAVLGDELELVPVTDLVKAREGDKVTLRVLSAGKPVSGAVVAVHHRAIGETDSKGEIRLRLRSSGVESISTSIRRPHPTPEADAEVLEASLTFEVGK
jgi:uncharacterized GH25 family protein